MLTPSVKRKVQPCALFKRPCPVLHTSSENPCVARQRPCPSRLQDLEPRRHQDVHVRIGFPNGFTLTQFYWDKCILNALGYVENLLQIQEGGIELSMFPNSDRGFCDRRLGEPLNGLSPLSILLKRLRIVKKLKAAS